MNLARALEINGWMSEPELDFLAECASRSTIIVEAGSYKGRSARAMADNSPDATEIYCVDPWDGDYQSYRVGGVFYNGDMVAYSLFCGNLGDYIIRGKVIPIRTYFTRWRCNKPVDFCFLDAIHEYQAVKDDIAHAISMMPNGGILAGHDYTKGWGGVIQAVDELYPNRKLVDSIWWVEL